LQCCSHYDKFITDHSAFFYEHDECDHVLRMINFEKLKDIVCPDLDEFVLSGKSSTICDAEQVEVLTGLMPNLKHVMLGFDNPGVQEACVGWKQLESLIVHPYAITDTGLTGVVDSVIADNRRPNITALKGEQINI